MIEECGPCTHRRPGRDHVGSRLRLRPSFPAAHRAIRGELLPSGPDSVCGTPLRRTRSSTPSHGSCVTRSGPRAGVQPPVRGFGVQGTTSSPPSTVRESSLPATPPGPTGGLTSPERYDPRLREGCESGRIGTLGKRVWGNSPWVRIPLPPLHCQDHNVLADVSFARRSSRLQPQRRQTGRAGRESRDGTIGVVTSSMLDDERGVDRQQIRDLLALSPAERVDRLVSTVAVWSEMLAHVGTPSRAR